METGSLFWYVQTILDQCVKDGITITDAVQADAIRKAMDLMNNATSDGDSKKDVECCPLCDTPYDLDRLV
jgi:hypothetical protein